MAGWLNGLLAELLSPAWTAGVLESFVGAAIAFLGAALLVRHQLRNDRQIADEQSRRDHERFLSELVATQEAQAATRRASAARTLGISLIDAADEWDQQDDPGVFTLLAVHGWQGDRAAPGAELLYRSAQVAGREIDLHGQPLDIWRARLRWWRAVRIMKDDPRILALPSDRRRRILFNLVDEKFSPQGAQLHELGRRLMRWDGFGDVPQLETEVPAPSDREAQRDLEFRLQAQLGTPERAE